MVPPTSGLGGQDTFLNARRVGEHEQICYIRLHFWLEPHDLIGNRLLHDPTSLSCLCSRNANRLGADACPERGTACHSRLQPSLATVTFRLDATMKEQLPQLPQEEPTTR